MVARLLPLLVLLLLAGCLEVDSVEVTVVADLPNDRLDVMLVSRGLSSSWTGTGIEHDLKDLLLCREVAAVPIPGVGVVDFTKQQEGDDRWQTLLPFLSVEAGAFFVDEKDRLSFYQFLRIEHAQAFVRAIEAMVRAEMANVKKGISPATQALMDRAVRETWPLVVMDGAGITIRRPLADADHRAEQARLWRDVVEAAHKSRDADEKGKGDGPLERGIVQVLRDNDVAVVRRPNVTEYVIGTLGAPTCQYRLRGEPYTDNLMQAFVQGEPRPPRATQALIDKQFDGFRGRAVRMPAAFTEAKADAQKNAPMHGK